MISFVFFLQALIITHLTLTGDLRDGVIILVVLASSYLTLLASNYFSSRWKEVSILYLVMSTLLWISVNCRILYELIKG